MSDPATTGELADWILNRLPATGGDVDFTRLELETRINAALAAEERRANDSIRENVRLLNRLAAEQEKVERMSKAYMVCNQDWQTATEQLDAAKAEDTRLADRNVLLHDRLDAAVEALRQVREWHDDNTHTGQFIDAALAKIST